RIACAGEKPCRVFPPIAGRLEFAGSVEIAFPMQCDPHGAGQPFLTHPAGEAAGYARLHEETVLREADRTGRAAFDRDPLCDFLMALRLPVARVLRPVHRAARIPGPLPKVRLYEEGHVVAAQPLKTAVVEPLRPHRRDEVAQILHKLAVLEWADLPRTER